MIPTLRALWHRQDGKLRCAWCDDEAGRAALPGESHGVCQRHKAALIAEARYEHQGKRADQVAYSALVLLTFALLMALIVLAGAWLAIARWGWL